MNKNIIEAIEGRGPHRKGKEPISDGHDKAYENLEVMIHPDMYNPE